MAHGDDELVVEVRSVILCLVTVAAVLAMFCFRDEIVAWFGRAS